MAERISNRRAQRRVRRKLRAGRGAPREAGDGGRSGSKGPPVPRGGFRTRGVEEMARAPAPRAARSWGGTFGRGSELDWRICAIDFALVQVHDDDDEKARQPGGPRAVVMLRRNMLMCETSGPLYPRQAGRDVVMSFSCPWPTMTLVLFKRGGGTNGVGQKTLQWR